MIARSKKEDDGTTTITVLVENLDRLSAPDLRILAARAISDSDGNLVIDCAKLEFLDSSGLGAFLHAHNLLPEHRRPVRLANVGPKVLTILELMQVHRLFEIESKS